MNREDEHGADALRAQVESLQSRLRELALATDWYLQRIHELEASIGAGERGSPPSGSRGARKPDSPPEGALDRGLERMRHFEAELDALQTEAAEKERVIAELAAAAQERLEAIERIDREAGVLRDEVATLRRELDEKERVVAALSTARDEDRGIIDQQAPGKTPAAGSSSGP